MNRRGFLKTAGAAAVAAGLAGGPARRSLGAGGPAAAERPGDTFYKGGDVSLLQKIEDLGGVYREGGKPKDPLAIFKGHGCNLMRLRLFHSPDGKGPVVNDLLYTCRLGQRIKAAGLALLLDIHYSDTWADPNHQSKPRAWHDLPPDRLEQEVFAYTRDAVAALRGRGALPDVIQVGNEITPGMLWDTGRVGGRFDTPAQWKQFGALVRSGLRGVRAALAAGENVRTMIHIDRGGDAPATRWFLDHLAAQGVEFDLIGQSCYPWWHGSLDDLSGNLDTTARRYRKDIVVVETGFPWTTKGFDEGGNVFDGTPARMKTSYPPTPEGQKEFLAEVIRRVRQTPDGRGRGVVYWAPEWIAVKGLASAWENVALFDQDGNVLPAMAAFAG